MKAFHRRVKELQQAEVQRTTMTLAEQIRQEGVSQGLSRGRQESVIETLEIRFGGLPAGLKKAVGEIQDTDHLKRLHREAIRCADIEAFTAAL